MGLLEDKGRVRLFYRYLSVVYDRINPFIWNEQMREEAVARLDIEADDRVLDVGCGTGFATEALVRESDHVHGLDQSPHQLARAFEKFGRRGQVRFCLGDAERLPYAADSFDVVWSSGSIEYWPNPAAALAEIRRVTRPGGRVLVVGPAAPEGRLRRAIADAIMLFYDEAEADRMFAAAGFEDVEHHRQRASARSPPAITTVAEVPDE